jgi:hypothetical protein
MEIIPDSVQREDTEGPNHRLRNQYKAALRARQEIVAIR